MMAAGAGGLFGAPVVTSFCGSTTQAAALCRHTAGCCRFPLAHYSCTHTTCQRFGTLTFSPSAVAVLCTASLVQFFAFGMADVLSCRFLTLLQHGVSPSRGVRAYAQQRIPVWERYCGIPVLLRLPLFLALHFLLRYHSAGSLCRWCGVLRLRRAAGGTARKNSSFRRRKPVPVATAKLPFCQHLCVVKSLLCLVRGMRTAHLLVGGRLRRRRSDAPAHTAGEKGVWTRTAGRTGRFHAILPSLAHAVTDCRPPVHTAGTGRHSVFGFSVPVRGGWTVDLVPPATITFLLVCHY